MKLSNEAKVGGLLVATGLVTVVLAWLLGIETPFRNTVDFYVTYNFAGGVELGSPVRVSGIKVGKVEAIDFFTPSDTKNISIKEPGSNSPGNGVELNPVRLKISVLKKAAKGVKKDSHFYINLAGIIGERYIEITSGSANAEPIKTGDVVAGVDPPRIDQLISQSFDLAGKITDLVEKNKGDITRSIELLYKLSGNLNTTLKWVDESKLFKTDISKLINNLILITEDVKILTAKTQTPEGKKTLDLLHQLLWRLEPLDSKQVRDFLQKEGVKIQVF